MAQKIAVAIWVTEPVFRQDVREYLECAGDIIVVGEAKDEQEVPEELFSRRPAVLLADLDTLGDPRRVAYIAARFPETRLIVLHSTTEEVQVLEALRQGAWGHLAKEGLQPTEVIQAVRTVARGEAYLSPTAAGWVVEEVARRLRKIGRGQV